MKKTLIVLVAALVLLGLLLWKNKATQRSHQRDVFALDTNKRAEVTLLKISKKPDTSTLHTLGGKWVVARDSFPVDTGKVNRVLKALLSLQTKEVVSTNPARASEYGLDSAEAKHVILQTASGKPMAEVVVGRTSSADYNSTYWKWEGKNEVYRSPGNFTWEIGVKDQEWKDRKLFPIAAKDVRSVDVTWKDSLGAAFHYKVEAVNDSTWKLMEPDTGKAKKDPASDMASRFADMSIDDFVAAGDTNAPLAKVDSPMAVIKVGLKEGKQLELKVGQSLGGYAYAKHPDRNELIKLSTWRMDAFRKKPFELIDVEVKTVGVDSAKEKAQHAPGPGTHGHGRMAPPAPGVAKNPATSGSAGPGAKPVIPPKQTAPAPLPAGKPGTGKPADSAKSKPAPGK